MADGAHRAVSVASAVEAVEVVLTSLSDEVAVRGVALGQGGARDSTSGASPYVKRSTASLPTVMTEPSLATDAYWSGRPQVARRSRRLGRALQCRRCCGPLRWSVVCGRTASALSRDETADLLDVDQVDAPELPKRWNVAPTQELYMAATTSDGTRKLRALRWGLVPSWADHPTIGSRLINARERP